MNRRGFTLLEVMLALGVMVVLVAGLAGISTAALKLSRRVVEAQQEEAVRDGFERILRENLTEIATDSSLRLIESELGAGQVLIIGNASGIFPIANVPLVTESLALESQRDRSGLLGLEIVYYAGDYWQAMQDGVIDEELLVRVPLRDGFEKLEWFVYDVSEDEWIDVWEEGSRRPHFLELSYRFGGDPADSRMIVWLPQQQSLTPTNSTGGSGGQNPGDSPEGGVRPPGGGSRPGGTNPPTGGSSGRPSTPNVKLTPNR